MAFDRMRPRLTTPPAAPTSRAGERDLVRVAVFDFLQAPTMRLTAPQAARLWRMDPGACRRLLDDFVDDGFLVRAPNGMYERPVR